MTRKCTAQDLMSDVKVLVDTQATLLQVMEKMHRTKCPYALVTGENLNAPCIITMTDMVQAVVQKGEFGDWLNEETVEQYMSPNLIMVKTIDLCRDILDLFVKTKVHQIVVIEEHDPVGVITLVDLTTWFFGSL